MNFKKPNLPYKAILINIATSLVISIALTLIFTKILYVKFYTQGYTQGSKDTNSNWNSRLNIEIEAIKNTKQLINSDYDKKSKIIDTLSVDQQLELFTKYLDSRYN